MKNLMCSIYNISMLIKLANSKFNISTYYVYEKNKKVTKKKNVH